MAISDCIGSIRRAVGDDLSDDEALEILEQLDRHRERLAAEGRVANLEGQLREFGRDTADEAKRAAMLQRRQAAINILNRDRINEQIDRHVGNGLTRPRAVLAIMEGTVRGIRAARKSVMATSMAYEGMYLGRVFSARAAPSGAVVELDHTARGAPRNVGRCGSRNASSRRHRSGYRQQ